MADVAPDRRDPRIKVQSPLYLRRLGYKKAAVELLDISSHGAQIEAYEQLPPGTNVWLTLKGLQPVQARVAWLKGWVAGLAFTTPLHPAVLELLVTRLKK